MSSRAPTPPPPPGRREPAGLPAILGIEVRRTSFREPRLHFVGLEPRAVTEAVEILVRTAGELPAVAVTPVLWVGDAMVRDYEPAGPGSYRFLVFEPERLRAGAPIAFGWPDMPERRVDTGFRFQLPGGPTA